MIGRNPVFLNSLFCMCIPILFLSISYPCIVGILQFKRALTELLVLQIVVKENLAWFVPLLLRRRPPQLSCCNDRRVQRSRDPASRLSFAASDLLPCRWQPCVLEDYTVPQERSHSFLSAYVMHRLILHATLSSCSALGLPSQVQINVQT